MSLPVMVWVMKHSEAALGARLTLLCLAEFAHDDGTKAFPAVATLAERTRMSQRGVQAALRRLEADGEIERTGTTLNGTNVYRIFMGGADSAGVKLTTGGGEVDDTQGRSNFTQPVINHQGPTMSERERAGARLPKISGRTVNRQHWALTGEVLTAFNSLAGTKLRLLTSSGGPSEAAKRIYGRVRDYPDIELAEHVDIIGRTLASKWWGIGPPSIGVVYGPKVFEDNITRSPTPATANGRNSLRDRDRLMERH